MGSRRARHVLRCFRKASSRYVAEPVGSRDRVSVRVRAGAPWASEWRSVSHPCLGPQRPASADNAEKQMRNHDTSVHCGTSVACSVPGCYSKCALRRNSGVHGFFGLRAGSAVSYVPDRGAPAKRTGGGGSLNRAKQEVCSSGTRLVEFTSSAGKHRQSSR